MPINRLLAVLLLILLGFALYANTFHAEFQFDDKDFIVNNPAIRDVSDIRALWNVKGEHSRFITFLTFALNYHIHRLDVLGYHLVNVVIHIVNALLVAWFVMLTVASPVVGGPVLRPLSESGEGSPPLRSNENLIPLFAALIFLTHPVQTESVSYISQRFASLATMFYLLALCLYITARRGGVSPPSEGRGDRAPTYILSALCAVLAMLSKQIAFTLPIMIILYEIYFLYPADRFRRGAVSAPSTEGRGNPAPTIVIIGAFLFFILFIPFLYKFNLAGILGRESLSRSHEGDYLYWLTYLLTQFRVLVVYLKLLFVPVGLNFEYDFPASITLFEPATFLSFLFLLALLGLGIWLFQRQRILSFCIVWFFVTLIVESSIIVLPHVIYEHRLYLPMVGFAILLAHGIMNVGAGFPRPSKEGAETAPLRAWILVIIIAMYSALTIHRNQVWQSGIALWSDVIHKSPAKARPYHNRGFHYLQKGAFEEALSDFNEAISRNPRYLQAYSNRATALRALGRPDLALEDYNTAIALVPYNAQALLNRGTLYAGMGQTASALADYKQALASAPDYYLVYYNRGRLYTQLTDYDRAIEDFNETIRLNPEFPFSYAERGKAYLYKRRNEEATQDFTAAIMLNPRDQHSLNNRAIVYARLKEYDKAFADFNAVLSLDTNNADAYLNRSLLYLAQGKAAQALEDARKAQQLGMKDIEKYLEQLETLTVGAPVLRRPPEASSPSEGGEGSPPLRP